MFGNIPFKIHLLLGCFLPYYVIFPGTTCAMELVLDMGVP